MMTRLEELMEQKRLIEKEIRNLRDNAVYSKSYKAKLEYQHYSARADEWVLCIKTSIASYRNRGKERWLSIISKEEKQEVIEEIPMLINELQELYKKLNGGESNEETL